MPRSHRSSAASKVSVSSPENPHLVLLRKRVTKAPEDPGIYRWLDKDGTVLYVGKAKNLRNRLRSYVNAEQAVGPWKQSFLRQIADFEVTVMTSELEALIFETNLIKQLKPKYNVLMKDDKSYVYARVTIQDAYPRVESVRRIDPSDGSKYFGPMSTGSELWNMLSMLRKIFPFRTCKMEIEPTTPPPAPPHCGGEGRDTAKPLSPEPVLSRVEGQWGEGLGRGVAARIPIEVICKHRDRPTPCLDHHIGKCSAPCVGNRTPEEYRQESIEGVLKFLKGDYEGVKDILKERMRQAAADRKFELAAQLRDHLLSLEGMERKQVASDTTGEDSDIFAVALRGGKAHVVVLQRRSGRLIGDTHFSLLGEAESGAEVLEQFLPQYYSGDLDIPETAIIAEDIADRAVLEEWLTQKKGRKVKVLLPECGQKSRLLQLAEKNVQEKARLQEVKWEAEKRNTEIAMQELQTVLALPSSPKRIEGYDISHMGGTETVGSMVVMKDGKAANDQYRSFTIRTVKEGEVDDYQALREVLRRRMRRLTEDLPAEEEKWKEQGIVFGKALKKEWPRMNQIFQENKDKLSQRGLDYRDFTVARVGEDIIGFARLIKHKNGLQELKSLWVSPEHRGDKLGQFIVRKILRSVKKGKVYITIESELEEYYGEIGFRYILKLPQSFDAILEQEQQASDVPKGIAMMWEPHQNKIDPSLCTWPDLLVIDGGKGQLGAAVEVLSEYQLTIPVIGLAKREEEVFVPGNPDPVTFAKDSPAKFLLMRLRDEAHRFANRHREGRGVEQAKASILDEVPGIGDKAKRSLLKKFGSVEGIRSASDDQLREILTPMQVQQVRRVL